MPAKTKNTRKGAAAKAAKFTPTVKKTKVLPVRQDFGRFLILFLTGVVMLLMIVVFFACAAVMLQKNFPANLTKDTPPMLFVQSVNYRGYQLPRGMPQELMIGKTDKHLIASQEMTDELTYSLKYVSFRSRINSDVLLSYYQNYLFKNLYLQSAVLQPDKTIEIQGQRGPTNLQLIIKPAESGSIVSVYQKVAK
jgi:hypothetical protein